VGRDPSERPDKQNHPEDTLEGVVVSLTSACRTPEKEKLADSNREYCSRAIPSLLDNFAVNNESVMGTALRQGNAAVELSEVSVPTPSRSDTVFGSIPSFFIRVMNVVRLSPSRKAAPLGPPTRPLASLRVWMI
jgi:hypothetical protein